MSRGNVGGNNGKNRPTSANSTSNNFKVVIRVRPPLPREMQGNYFLPVVQVGQDSRSVSIMEYFGREIEDRAKAIDIE